MTPDQISKLLPKLQRAAELCEKATTPMHWHRNPSDSANCDICREQYRHRREFEEIKYDSLTLALTYCLQMQEERDAAEKTATLRVIDRLKKWIGPVGAEGYYKAKAAVLELETKLSTAEATIATLRREKNELEKQLSRIAETVSRFPTVTGLQEACVKDHSLIWMAIRDAQDAYADTVKRLTRDAALSHTPEGKK